MVLVVDAGWLSYDYQPNVVFLCKLDVGQGDDWFTTRVLGSMVSHISVRGGSDQAVLRGYKKVVMNIDHRDRSGRISGDACRLGSRPTGALHQKKQPRRGGCFSWKVEATTGFEPVNGGFANLWLTTCLRRQRDTGMQCNRVGQALKCVIAWFRTERPPLMMDASHDFDCGLKASSRAASAFPRSPPQ